MKRNTSYQVNEYEILPLESAQDSPQGRLSCPVCVNHSLRKRVDAGHNRKLIRTVRGVGYQLGTDIWAGREAAGRGER